MRYDLRGGGILASAGASRGSCEAYPLWRVDRVLPVFLHGRDTRPGDFGNCPGRSGCVGTCYHRVVVGYGVFVQSGRRMTVAYRLITVLLACSASVSLA